MIHLSVRPAPSPTQMPLPLSCRTSRTLLGPAETLEAAIVPIGFTGLAHGDLTSTPRPTPVAPAQPAPTQQRILVTDTDPAVIESTPIAAHDFEIADLAALVAAHDFSRPFCPGLVAAHA
ncbi:hypothetical protein ASF47_18855 [Nocardioides sp. Leaf285]|nr:hypothetical protein ASF47_18855 [Nocardioides sp. Leaf285]